MTKKLTKCKFSKIDKICDKKRMKIIQRPKYFSSSLIANPKGGFRSLRVKKNLNGNKFKKLKKIEVLSKKRLIFIFKLRKTFHYI